MPETFVLDRDRIRSLFDLRGSYHARAGGDFTADPYPVWRELRERAEVHEGTVHELTGYPGDLHFQGLPVPERPHYSAFSYAALEDAYRDPGLFASSPEPVDLEDGAPSAANSMLSMGGDRHRRYRALVQPSFAPARARWWIMNWIERTARALVDGFAADGHAELNTGFCAAIPVLTITSSFGIPVDRALDMRDALRRPAELIGMIAPIVAARREDPQDDLITVLTRAEITDEDGTSHRLSDAEIHSFALLLLAAGSGTTWKQMGIVLAILLQRPDLLAAVREDRALLKPVIDEALRWMPTDPAFARYVTRDTDFHGTRLPEGAVLHLCLGAANRDPDRWERPEEFDAARRYRPSLAFGSGEHICMGMHVARAEIATGVGALLDRLPGLRLDPDREPPRFIGMYERGVTEIPVLFG
ncbi:MAG: cytochrome P450 [Streptosporangiales bacterium]|nr:cytochrome P450 [Streptosporangiales bacterium]